MRCVLIGLLGFALLSCSHAEGPFSLATDQLFARVSLAPFSLVVKDATGKALLATLPESTAPGPYGAPGGTFDLPSFVGQALAGWDGYQAHEGAWLRSGTAQVLARTATSARLQLGQGDSVIILSLELAGARLDLHLEAQGTSRNKTGLSFSLPDDEHFFGLGERFASLDHRGRSLYSWAEEGGLGQGEQVAAGPGNPYPNGPSMTWFPVPFFLSSRGYGLRLATTSRIELHLGSERPDAWRVAVSAPCFALTLWAHEDPLQTLSDYTQETGRPRIPVPWAFGPRRTVGLFQQAQGTDEWRALRRAHVPTTALDDNVHFLPARSERGREAELTAWTTQLHASGFKVLGYYAP